MSRIRSARLTARSSFNLSKSFSVKCKREHEHDREHERERRREHTFAWPQGTP